MKLMFKRRRVRSVNSHPNPNPNPPSHSHIGLAEIPALPKRTLSKMGLAVRTCHCHGHCHCGSHDN